MRAPIIGGYHTRSTIDQQRQTTVHTQPDVADVNTPSTTRTSEVLCHRHTSAPPHVSPLTPPPPICRIASLKPPESRRRNRPGNTPNSSNSHRSSRGSKGARRRRVAVEKA